METRSIGSLEVSVVGLGTNNFGMGMSREDVPPVVEAALDSGINFFDTSDSYAASEELLGLALRGRRDEVVLATKFGSAVKGQSDKGGARPEYVRLAVDASLRRLGTDRIDLYQLHRPDPETPIGDTLGALAEAVAAGKVREIGCSNYALAQLQQAEAAAGEGPHFVSVQNHYNLLNRADEADVLPECEERGIAYLPYFPLASGLLTGKYRRGEAPPEGTRLKGWSERGIMSFTDETFDVVDVLAGWAKAHDHELLELAFAWLLAHSAIPSVIAGATRREQVEMNVAAGQWVLTPSELGEVNGIITG